MIIDAFLQFSSAQAVTATAVSTNTIDLGIARDVGPGEEMEICITVDQSFATATSVNIQVISSAAANLGTPSVLIETGAIVIANLTAGRRPIVIRMPRTLVTALGQRYLGLQYTVAGSNATAGQFTANLLMDAADTDKLYAVGTTIN